uniref:Uncharacterized protein n=1 Tax=Onchocerca volvulus TaxID=6282 RepID=A0A8R1XPA7_ONCVO
MNPDRSPAKDSAMEYEDLLENYEIQRIDMRRDISPISNKENQSFMKLGTGNRMAAILLYNAALFWYNLIRSSEIGLRSRLATRPTLKGVERKATKRFHQQEQEYHRLCDLNQFDQERYVGDFDSPEPKHRLNIRSEAKKSKKMNEKY